MKKTIALLLITGIFSCQSINKAQDRPEKPKNIIFLIGDGMGLAAVSTTVYFGDEVTEFGGFNEIGLIITSSANEKVTDSGASGTAMASGVKTYNGAIGVDTSRIPVENIAECLSSLGWSTGVVSTSSITHATPASFYAHTISRGMEEEIASQLVESGIDFFAGGGKGFFNKRSDGRALLAEAESKGFTMDTTGLPEPGSFSLDHKYGFLLAPGGMPSKLDGRDDFLPRATDLAIEYLSKDQDGFFLMVEGSQVDWEEHGNRGDGVIAEMLDFEKAIRVALEFARKDGNTLVIVSADHETGGLALPAKVVEGTEGYEENTISPSFSTTNHTASMTPVFAFGPGSEAFGGIYQNTGIFYKMVAAVKGD